jgi:hypothetical protein
MRTTRQGLITGLLKEAKVTQSPSYYSTHEIRVPLEIYHFAHRLEELHHPTPALRLEELEPARSERREPTARSDQAESLKPPEEPARRRRRLTVARAIREIQKAGASIARVEIEPDGRIALTFGERTTPKSNNELDDWMAKHARSTERH